MLQSLSARVITQTENALDADAPPAPLQAQAAYFGRRGLKRIEAYLTSTFAPASSSFFFIVSESALLTASFTVEGTPSTRSLASFRPRPVISRITLITVTFLSAGYSLRTTVNSVFSSAGAAAAAPAPAAGAAATAAAAVTPNFFSISEMSSTTSINVILEIASRISSLLTAMWGLLSTVQ